MTTADTDLILGIKRKDVVELAQSLQLMGNDDDRKALTDLAKDGKAPAWDDPTLVSFQAMKSGTQAATVFWTKQIKTYGGGTAALLALATGISSGFKVFADANVPNSIIITLIGAATVLLVAAAIAIAWIISADMTSRSEATAARAHGRARLADAYLETINGKGPIVEQSEKRVAPDGQAMGESHLLIAVAGNWPVKVTTKDGTTDAKVKQVFTHNGKLRFKTDADDTLNYDEVANWYSAP